MICLMLSRFLLALAALLAFPMQALAQEIEGSWAFRIDDATIFSFEIEREEDGDWRGSWTRPASFRSNGMVFAQLTGSQELEAMAALEFAGTIELSFEDARPGAVPDIFRFRPVSENQAELIYVGTDLDPYPLVRVLPGSGIGPFEENRIYDRDNAVIEADYAAPPAEVEDESTQTEETDEEEAGQRIDADFLDGL